MNKLRFWLIDRLLGWYASRYVRGRGWVKMRIEVTYPDFDYGKVRTDTIWSKDGNTIVVEPRHVADGVEKREIRSDEVNADITVGGCHGSVHPHPTEGLQRGAVAVPFCPTCNKIVEAGG